jgi:hypothetical protein
MLKAGTFLLGITSGVYLGIYLREQGYSAGLTRAYYAYKNEELTRGSNKKLPNKATIDDLYDYFNAGMLRGEQLEKFKEMVKSKQYDKIDDVVINDIEKIFNDPALQDIKRKYNSRLYDK